jgi:hypothetical protein
MIDHYWISLDYENGFIIDATARQFNSALEYVHFGEKLAEEGNYNFKDVYDKWSVPLINNKFNEIILQHEMLNVPPQNQIQMPPIEPYIKIGIRAAIILLRDNKPDNNNKRYLECICQAAKNFYGEDLQKIIKLRCCWKIAPVL